MTTAEEPLNHFRDITENGTDPQDTSDPIHACSFTKQQAETVLRVSWDGNLALFNCTSCCMRWFLTIDGEECTDPGPIDAAISRQLTDTYEIARPSSIIGICRGVGGEALAVGSHMVELLVEPCTRTDPTNTATVPDPSSTLTGLYSVSRFVVEEIPNNTQDCSQQG